jgi:predicted O-methyltransferase YrrM
MSRLLRPAPPPPADEPSDLPAATLHLFDLLKSVERSGLPTIALEEVVRRLAADRPEPLRGARVHPSLVGVGSGSAAEMAALAVITAAKWPRRVLEFGTYDGASTWHLWANARPGGSVTTVDLPPGTTVAGSTDPTLHGVRGRPFLPESPDVRVVEVDSRAWEPDPGAAYDLCFIDAGHSYECVRNDTEKARRALAPGGVIVWHDATWAADGYGVNRYLRELVAAGDPVALVRLSLYDYCALAVLLPRPA